MNRKFLLPTALAILIGLTAHTQSGGGTGQGPGAGNQSTIKPGPSGIATPGTSVAPLPNGQTRATPSVQNQVAPNQNINSGTNGLAPNQSLNTNAFGITTNQFLGGTNLSPTGRTNSSVLATNFNPGAVPIFPR